MSSPVTPESLAAAKLRAEQASAAGDWAGVKAALDDVVTSAAAGADTVALWGWACLRQGDATSADAAADRALGMDARSLRASLLKADVLFGMGLQSQANIYYRAVVEFGAGRGGLPAELQDGVRRATEFRDRLAKNIFAALQTDLDQLGYEEGRSSPRFTQALDLASGKKTAYFQQPQNFYFPELPNIQFYPREAFPWMAEIEAATDQITTELEGVLAEDAAFAPYLQTLPHLPSQRDYPLVDSMDWSSCFLWKDGAPTAAAEKCPVTMAVLEKAPLCRIAGRSPQVMFSQLKPGAHIRPHTGAVNTRLICHLPLIVPPNCRFRVGNDVRNWEKGKAFVFDDTIEHEAINGSDRNRVVLIFDIWRPELTEEERGLVAGLLESLDAYSPRRGVWE